MALELAIKATIVKTYGLVYILQNIDSSVTNDELEEMYIQNKLKTKEFDQLRNFMKTKNMFDFEKDEYAYMQRFQLYRNRLVHFNYKFSSDEDIQIENDIIHVLVYILGVIMSDDVDMDNRTYMQEYIDMDEYEKLLENPKYLEALLDMIDYEEGDPYYCPICKRKLLTSNKKCLGCLQDFGNHHCYGYVKCNKCHEKMVIYDKLNMSNNIIMPGLCLYCLEHTQVYRCSTCGSIINLKDSSSGCKPGFCEWE
jgi:hypothetical protein